MQHWLASVWPEPDWQQLPAGSLLTEVRQRGTLVVAVREYPRPAPPEAPTPPEPDGFDAGMARFIAEKLGVKLKLVGLKAAASGDAYAVPTDAVDLVVAGAGAAQVLATAAPSGGVPTPYSEATMQLMVLRGSAIHTAADLRQKSVCLQRGSSHANELAAVLGALPRAYPSGVHAVYAFMSGECDALAEDAGLVQRLATREEWRFYRPIPLRTAMHITAAAGGPEIAMARPDATSAAYIDAVVRYWQFSGAQSEARAQRTGNVSFELLQLQDGMICHA